MADRYPFAPLEALVLVDVGPRIHDSGQDVGRARLVAEVLGVDRRQVIRWRTIGVTADQADRLAVAAKRHPFEVWPELKVDPTVGCADCGLAFVPDRKNARFCSRACYRRWDVAEAARKRTAARPPSREKECARERCGRQFTARPWNRKFCSVRCQRHEKQRRYNLNRYHRDPDFAERERQRNKNARMKNKDHARDGHKHSQIEGVDVSARAKNIVEESVEYIDYKDDNGAPAAAGASRSGRHEATAGVTRSAEDRPMENAA